ncbi:LysR family transcriptional regulator ArgP [Vibrio rumoiensis]|uniref:LysR family transcriptional regulator ArgP n=1 Tax=Vibrio rumoiensis TaxID=76258 RepID=UPI003AA8EFD6
MSLLSPHVAAFIAVIEESSFEGAARKLSVTPSAISQRIKQLEDRIGQLLVVRQSPCKPTPAGKQLLSRVKPMSLLEVEVMQELMPDNPQNKQPKTLSIAVNEDSLTTWLLDAVAALSTEYGYSFDIRVDDQECTLEHLKNGAVIGALTSEKTPLQGCVTHALGCMKYCGIASPEFYERYFSSGLTKEAFEKAPVIVYNRKDPLQTRFMETITNTTIHPRNTHYIPSAVSLVDAVKHHMGWCVTAEGLLGDSIERGQVVNIAPELSLNEALYWQHAGVRSQVLSRVTKSFLSASAELLSN